MKLKTTEIFDELVDDVEELERTVARLERYEYDTKESIREWKELKRDNVEISRTATYKFADTNSDKIIKILLDEADKAITNSTEFKAYEGFRTNLEDSINSTNPISIDYSRGKISAIINMEEAAGDLEDYANAIKLAREILRQEAEEKNKTGKTKAYYPDLRSAYWRDHIWGKREDRKEYAYTMSLRFENFETKAPYWELLDKGVPQPMSSNKGGFPTPSDGPSRFVSLAKERIETFAQDNIESYKDQIKEQIQDNIDNNEQYLDDLTSDIYYLLDLIDSLNSEEFKAVKEELEDRYEERLPKADPAKIRDLAKRLAAGEELPDRIRIGGGERIRTILLQREIEAELRRIQGK